MLKSMTGFARATDANAAYEVVVEIRSVNHRYLDVKLRGATGLASLDKKVRDCIAASLGRGKVDVAIHLKPKSESAYELEVDRPLMDAFVTAAKELGREAKVGTELGLSDLVGFSPAFRVRERDLGNGAPLWDALEPALVRATKELDGMREAEGAEMEADLSARMQTLAAHVERVDQRSTDSRKSKRAELSEKVQELLGNAVEPPAIAMEVARLVERSDVAEEITRLRSHLELWKEAVAASGPCGKKLDFIVQEMNREVNTIGSKCQDAEMSAQVIAMKSELERVREQVQNIE